MGTCYVDPRIDAVAVAASAGFGRGGRSSVPGTGVPVQRAELGVCGDWWVVEVDWASLTGLSGQVLGRSLLGERTVGRWSMEVGVAARASGSAFAGPIAGASYDLVANRWLLLRTRVTLAANVGLADGTILPELEASVGGRAGPCGFAIVTSRVGAYESVGFEASVQLPTRSTTLHLPADHPSRKESRDRHE